MMNNTKNFDKSREQNSLESAEDYTELIYDLISLKGEARVVDIAASLGISHVTAIRTISRLEKKGFLITKSRSPITLTKKGTSLALFSKNRHQTLLKFLLFIGVPKQVAEKDVEGMEHHVSKTTLKTIESYMGQHT